MTGAERTALYRLYDAAGQLLYVGVTSNPKKRWEFHRHDKPWWGEVAVREIEWLPSRVEALAREATEIAQWLPRYNIHGGWQYLVQPVVPTPDPSYPPARGTTKLPTPTQREMELLWAAVRAVRDQEERDGRFAAPRTVSLPEREERIWLRRTFGISQERLSSDLGVNTIKFRNWENGRKSASGWERLMYARALQVMSDVLKERSSSGA